MIQIIPLESIEPDAEVQEIPVENEKRMTSEGSNKVTDEQTQPGTSSTPPPLSSNRVNGTPITLTQLYLRWYNYQENLTNVFHELLWNESFVDVTLACDGQSIKAHKIILSACSPFFQALFIDHPHQHPIIVLDVEWPELRAIVEFMYTGEINVNQDLIGPLLRIAEMLEIRGLAFGRENCGNGGNAQRSGKEATSNSQNANRGEKPWLAHPLLIDPEMKSKTKPIVLEQNDNYCAKNISSHKMEATPQTSPTKDVPAPLVIPPDEKTLAVQSTLFHSSSPKAEVTDTKVHEERSTQTDSSDLEIVCSKAFNIEDKNENAWVPQTIINCTRIDDDQHVVNKIRGILNKLTPENFNKLTQSALNLPINTKKRIHMVGLLIFEKTVSEITFAKTYYRFCIILFKAHTMLITILLDCLQEEFYANVSNGIAKAVKLKPLIDRLAAVTDPKERQDIKRELDDKEYTFRLRAWGTVSFIGELFKVGIISENVMCTCVETLLDVKCDDKLEFMCKLLIVAGPKLETAEKQQWKLENIFHKIRQIVDKNKQGTGHKVSNRVRFMMQDVLELRHRSWDQEFLPTKLHLRETRTIKRVKPSKTSS